MVATVNPCGFAMLPAYLALYLGANSQTETRSPAVQRLGRALLVGVVVTAGFVLLFGVVGGVISAGAQSIKFAIPWIGLCIGVLLALAGAWLLSGGKLYSGIAARAASHMGDPSSVSVKGYFLFGLSYATASLSCTLPIFLAVIGTSLATGGFWSAVGQFIVYALGMGTVILVLTLAVALFRGATVGALRKVLPYTQTLSAAFMILAGAYIVFYWLTAGGLVEKF
ncbi:MAG: cytochrome c biogenesis protein CcdA [SAR202 cluster bacterium]|nr:cytochrome c biogenesis protein CcdA [SAR202 cluster bacterium]